MSYCKLLKQYLLFAEPNSTSTYYIKIADNKIPGVLGVKADGVVSLMTCAHACSNESCSTFAYNLARGECSRYEGEVDNSTLVHSEGTVVFVALPWIDRA